MSHAEALAELLRPLGVYDLRTGTVNRGELDAYGAALDGGLDELEETEREMCLTTAEGLGLSAVEALLPYRPASETTAQRRQALAALLRIGGDSFTPAAINDTLRGCGIPAQAAETAQPGYVEVSFPGSAGIPEHFQRLRTIIEEILPCHLEITYVFWYNSWAEVARRYPTWGEATAAGLSWYQLATERD
jgi:hypothetical protein